MITYQLERIDEAYDAYAHYWLEIYHHEVANQDYPPFGAANIDTYHKLEDMKVLRLMVAREKGQAIGYCTALVSRSFQSGWAHIAQIDMLFVRPDKRKLFVGLLLLKHMIERLRDEGVQQFRATSSARFDSGAVWRFLGFEMTGMIYEKLYPARG
jgi:GNAT superfamily N-acetyltransferase